MKQISTLFLITILIFCLLESNNSRLIKIIPKKNKDLRKKCGYETRSWCANTSGCMYTYIKDGKKQKKGRCIRRDEIA